MTAYYNEFNPEAAAWLRQLIKNGDIALGEVDERSIIDVSAEDLRGFTQHHFFAGIGTWSYALRNAGWPDDRPVCTASLPCQPFSVAGNQKGKQDERHLLPHFIELVRQCNFDIIIGEQVEAAIRHGWLDDLQANMEAENYALGHAVLGAHSLNAPHQRQRLYWVAYSNNKHRRQQQQLEVCPGARVWDKLTWRSQTSGLGYTNGHRCEQGGEATQGSRYGCTANSASRVDYTNVEWLYCQDGKYRPIKPGITPLVTRIARGVVYSGGAIDANNTGLARKIRLMGYGNAIPAKTAQVFIESVMEVID